MFQWIKLKLSFAERALSHWSSTGVSKSIVTTSMNSESNSLFQEQLGVGLALSGGELPISCPNLLVLAPKPLLGPQQQITPSFVRWDLVIPDLPYHCLFLDSLSHRCAISWRPLSISPFPGEEGWAPPLPLHTPINPTVDSPGGLGDGEEGGGGVYSSAASGRK